jgi:hypothetical protein
MWAGMIIVENFRNGQCTSRFHSIVAKTRITDSGGMESFAVAPNVVTLYSVMRMPRDREVIGKNVKNYETKVSGLICSRCGTRAK